MTFDDWVLALHVLSAVAYGAGIILFWVLVVAVRTTDTAEGTLRLAPTVMVGNIAIGIGAGGTIIFGVWLALSVRNYDLWDGWIIAALVLWVIAAILGQRTGKEYMRGMTRAQELQLRRTHRRRRGAAGHQPNVRRACSCTRWSRSSSC